MAPESRNTVISGTSPHFQARQIRKDVAAFEEEDVGLHKLDLVVGDGRGVVHSVALPGILAGTKLIGGAGYRTAYLGKWHLSQSPTPDMEAYGFGDWSGNDRHFMGWAGTGHHFDPIIAAAAPARSTRSPTPGARGS